MPNPSWMPNASVTPFGVIVDFNGNVQQAGAAGGITGMNPPAPWGANINDETEDNTVVWTCVAVFSAPSPSVTGLPAAPPMFLTDRDGLSVPAVVADMVAEFEAITGRALFPAQVERLYINFGAYREILVRQAIQYTGQQNLLAFASFPCLDFLGQLLNVSRLPSQPALVALQFVLQNVLTVPFSIPAGTPVGSGDGQVVFITSAALTIPAGQTTGTVAATCQTPGTAGNGYTAGEINVALAPNASIASAANTVTSNGGSAPETDDHLRARIQLGSNISGAGPSGAYRRIAFGVDPSIVDVQVFSPSPGTVNVCVLIGPAAEPASSPNSTAIAGGPLLGRVQAACSDETQRPLTDTVNAIAVTEVNYSINYLVTLFANADPIAVPVAVRAAAALFIANLAARIQRDIVPEEITAALTVPGVYRAQPNPSSPSPAFTPLTQGQWTNCTAITLSFVTGTEVM